MGNHVSAVTVEPLVRTWLGSMLLVSSVASADDGPLRLRERDRSEPLLHLDATVLDPSLATGGSVDGRAMLLDIGRVRWAAEGTWWQGGLAPNIFATEVSGWRAAGEVSYDVGPFRVGVNASLTRDGNGSHRTLGLFAYRTFRLSQWMHAWILLGIAFEQWRGDGLAGAPQGVTAGLSIGTTFR